ncbi:MAG: transglutaminase domain-containing protein [Nanoarchaeota archaeon]
MKVKYLLLVLLLLIPLAHAKEWDFNTQTLTFDLNIDSDIDIIKKTQTSKVSYIKVNLTFFPQDTNQQKILSLTTDPESTIDLSTIQYIWNNPLADNLKFSLNSKIQTYNKRIQVKEKIRFPLSSPEELRIYTQPSTTIDSDNPSVFALANHLAEGEDDLYKVVFNLAQWVKTNIEYDLSTLTADVSQKSSWVLQTRQGVCDELTNLFIGLNRALGIPAKFVSGISYTNSPLFANEWGPHGWAEVYFPGYGWIPYDVTYGEFGYIDPTHIELKEGLDANESSTKYQWLGNGVDIRTKSLNFKVNVKDYGGKVPQKIDLELDADKNIVAFGSYNLVEATIKNLQNYYISDEIYLSKPGEVEIIGDERKQILLEPNEEKRVYWIIKINDDLESKYIYTFPLGIFSVENYSDSTSFDSSESAYYYSLDEINSIFSLKQEKLEKIYSEDVKLDCTIDKDEFYEYEQSVVSCITRNNGNALLKDVNICLDNDCKKFNSIGIGEEKTARFDFIPKKTGEQELLIEVKTTKPLQNQFLEVNVKDIPKVEINELKNPDKALFDEDYLVSFILDKRSASDPKYIKIVLDQEGFKKTWELEELINDKKFDINLKGRDLGVGENGLKIEITFYDENNKEYKAEKRFTIDLIDVNLIQRVQIFFTDIGKWIGRLVG